jgi:hypothetical protein
MEVTKRRLICLIVATGFVLVAHQPLQAQLESGLDFLRACEGRDSKHREAGALACAAYLSGYLDGYALTNVEVPVASRRICLPSDGLAVEQAQLIVTKWLGDHPTTLHESARTSIFIALAQAFPCRQ